MGGPGRIKANPEADALIENETIEVSRSEYLMMKRRYSLFWPKGRADLLLDYPDLRRVQAFMKLDEPRKMLFVWFYACRISPIVENIPDDAGRIRESIKEAWRGKASPELIEKYTKKGWGPEVGAAIIAMRAYMADARIRLRLLLESNISRVQTLLEGDVKGLVTWRQRREFFEAVTAGTDLIGKMLPMVEEDALGVVDITDEKVWGEGKAMEVVHAESRNTTSDDDDDEEDRDDGDPQP